MRADAAATGALRASRLAYPLGVALILVGFATLVVWDVFHYDWLRGYDAWHNWRYEQAIEQGHLPTRADTDEWHNPPLFYAAARVAQGLGGIVGLHEPQRAVQLLGVPSGVGLALLAFLLARELFRSSRTAQLAALLFAIATPVLVRGSIMYHPEPLASLLAMAGVFVLVRALGRSRFTIGQGIAAGGLIGLACLTRTWALAVLIALSLILMAHVWSTAERRASLRMLVAFAGVAFVLTTPWLVYKAIRFGNPFAYSQPVAAQWKQSGRPASFYVGLSVGEVFSAPYAPHYRNRLLPVVYSDWWGDYWRYFRVPPALVNEPARLPDPYHGQLVEQSYVGILPSVLAVTGFLGLGWRAVRRRSFALLCLLAPLVLLGVAFLAFLIEYPKQDGDNIKALYVLDAVVPLAVCGGWALHRLLRLNRLLFAGVVLILFDVAFLDFRFLVLPA